MSLPSWEALTKSLEKREQFSYALDLNSKTSWQLKGHVVHSQLYRSFKQTNMRNNVNVNLMWARERLLRSWYWQTWGTLSIMRCLFSKNSNYTNLKNEYITWKEFKALNKAENGICNEFLTKYTASRLNHFGFQTKLSSSTNSQGWFWANKFMVC